MKRLVPLLIALTLFCIPVVQAQDVKQMKDQRARLEKKLAESKELLASTTKDVKSRLSRLTVLGERIKVQTELVSTMASELSAIDQEQKNLESELTLLEGELQKRKDHYASALKQSVHRNSFENRMLFLLSSDTFHQMYRRLRYLREYSDFQAQQGREIQQKQAELTKKREELEQLRHEKEELLARQQAEQQALASQRAEQQTLVSRLQKQQADIKSEIKRCQTEYDRLDKKIEQIINENIRASQKKKSSGSGKNAGKSSGSSTSGYKMSAEEVKLSGSFAANKGRLPVPVSGAYMLLNHYGINQVEGMKDVKLNNLGVDVKCGIGANVRNIFDGEVSTVFEHPTRKTYGILIRHGNYISVYCNLATTNVHQGQKLKAGATIGTVATDAQGDNILQFQLRKDLQRLNPEQWIKF